MKGIYMEETNVLEPTQEIKRTRKRSKASSVSDGSSVEEVSNKTSKSISPKDVDTSEYVVVKNGFHGRLVYKSRKTGELYVWDEFGAEQEMEIRELRNVRNSYKKFFINNWFMFDEDWLLDYLGVRQYYKNAIPIDTFDEIFELSSTDLKKRIEGLSDAQKKSVAYRAKELIAENKIDSLTTIGVLERALDISLIER
jgi:hypothetical protein